MRWLILLRGVNLGAANRLAMAELRVALADPAPVGPGLRQIRTYVQSGNVVAEWDGEDAVDLARRVRVVLETRFGLAPAVVVRTREELTRTIDANPFLSAATADPARMQVTFLGAPIEPAAAARLRALVRGQERLHCQAREIYSVHPDGIAGSKLAAALVTAAPDGCASSRNWRTVLRLSAMLAE